MVFQIIVHIEDLDKYELYKNKFVGIKIFFCPLFNFIKKYSAHLIK